MNITEFKPRKDIQAFYDERFKLSRNLANKVEIIENEIKQGKRNIDIAYLRLWANCNKTFNDLNLYNLHKFKNYHSNFMNYKTEALEGEKANQQDIEKCEIMIYAVSDLFELVYNFYKKVDMLCDLMLKNCDKLEQDKSLLGELENQSNIYKNMEDISNFELEFEVYVSEHLLPIMKEIEAYAEEIKKRGYQFGE